MSLEERIKSLEREIDDLKWKIQTLVEIVDSVLDSLMRLQKKVAST